MGDANNDQGPSIIGAGLLCLDIIMANNEIEYFAGGSCCNVVSALSAMGWSGRIISDCYHDEASIIISRHLNSLNIEQIRTSTDSKPTPRIIELLNSGISHRLNSHKFLFICPTCGQTLPKLNPLTPQKVKSILSDLPDAKVFYTDRASAGIRLIKSYYSKMGSWTVYEPNSARNVSVVLSNALESDIVKFSGNKISHELADAIRRQANNRVGIMLIVRTLEKEGLEYSYRTNRGRMSKWMSLESRTIADIVDSAGAGDWCSAGIISKIVYESRFKTKSLSEYQVMDALDFAQSLSVLSCQYIGAQGMIYASGGVNEMVGLDSKIRVTGHIKPAKLITNNYKSLCKTCLLEIPSEPNDIELVNTQPQ